MEETKLHRSAAKMAFVESDPPKSEGISTKTKGKLTKMEGNGLKNKSAKMAFEDQGNSTGLVENLVTIVDNLTTERENGKQKGRNSSKKEEADKDKDKELDKDKDMVPDPREVVDYEVKDGWKHTNWEEGISSPGVNYTKIQK